MISFFRFVNKRTIELPMRNIVKLKLMVKKHVSLRQPCFTFSFLNYQRLYVHPSQHMNLLFSTDISHKYSL